MPGVPSGRGCEACRKQKKKCDQLLPSCSRCTRLRIDCVGAGKRRFKFVRDGKSASRSSNSRSPSESQSPAGSQDDFQNQLSQIPSNASTGLAVALIGKFHDSSDLRYHLSWTYGDFLEEIPRRIGTNEALDASVAALISAHSYLGSNWTVVTTSNSLKKYNQALKTLRLTLDDAYKASQVETLCACYLLVICQSFIDTNSDRWSAHTEGAAQILKSRGYSQPDDVFEQKLLLSMRGPVMMEALLNDNISFTREEWNDLVESRLYSDTSEGRMIRCWAQMPDLMRRGKSALSGQGNLQPLIIEARQQYQILTMLLNQFRIRYDTFLLQPISPWPTVSSEQLHSQYQRIYGLCLAICLLSNCLVSALDAANADLEVDCLEMCKEVLRIAEQAAIYRPIGAGYMSLCLIAGWCASADPATKLALEDTLVDYLRDWPRRTTRSTLRQCLECISRRLKLLDNQRVIVV